MSQRVKVAVDVPQSIVGETVEIVWAEKIADTYRLLNSPWYAKGISYLDIVEAAPDFDGLLQLTRKVGTAGHSTYRLLIESDQDWEAYWSELQLLGCTYESTSRDGYLLLSVDVPPECNISNAYALMELGENAGVWQFEEGDINHPNRQPN